MNLFSFFIDFLLLMPKLLPVINLCTQKLLFSLPESSLILLNICNESTKVELLNKGVA